MRSRWSRILAIGGVKATTWRVGLNQLPVAAAIRRGCRPGQIAAFRTRRIHLRPLTHARSADEVELIDLPRLYRGFLDIPAHLRVAKALWKPAA
jgi:hypothetical protein